MSTFAFNVATTFARSTRRQPVAGSSRRFKMFKLYKNYSDACRFTNSTVEAVTLDAAQGFMVLSALRPVREIAHDTAAWMTSCKRHFVTAELPDGLFGSYWFDDITSVPARPIAQTLFSTEQASMDAHRVTVERYRADPK